MALERRSAVWTVALTCSIVLASMLASAGPAAESSGRGRNLRSMPCVRVDAEITEASAALGVTVDDVRQRLFRGVRARAPRLRIDETCEDHIVVWVHLRDISASPRLDGFYGHVRLVVLRPATITESRMTVLAEVWEKGVYLHGGTAIARALVHDSIADLATDLAADYHRAGNE